MLGDQFMTRSRMRFGAFHRDERGAVTLWMTFWMFAFLLFGSIAVDTSQAWRIKAMLQAAADAAAFGGAITLGGSTRHQSLEGFETGDPTDVALMMAQRNLPPEAMGTVLKREDVELGIWDPNRRAFVPGQKPHNAVRVTLRRAEANGNAEPTFLAGIVGHDAWDIEVQSVARIFPSRRAECINPIITARARVNFLARDAWLGICVHEKAIVGGEESDHWLSDEIIALADRIMLETLAPYRRDQFSTKHTDRYNERINKTNEQTDSIALIEQYLDRGNSLSSLRALASQAKAMATVTLSPELIDFSTLNRGGIYYVECDGRQTLSIPGDVWVSEVTILSECPVRVASETDLSSAVIVSNLNALRDKRFSHQPENSVDNKSKSVCTPGHGVRVMAFVNVESARRFYTFHPRFFPLGDILESIQHDGGSSADLIAAGVDVDLANAFLADPVLTDLLGLCLGGSHMLEVNAFALTK